MEECNYVSNAAYYHGSTRTCDFPDWNAQVPLRKAVKQAYTTLAMGSAFWHGSLTYLGVVFDNLIIAVVSYLAHSIMIEPFNSTNTMFTGLRDDIESISAVELSEHMSMLSLDKPITEWAEYLKTAPFQQTFYITFGALVSVVTSVTLPIDIAHWLV